MDKLDNIEPTVEVAIEAKVKKETRGRPRKEKPPPEPKEPKEPKERKQRKEVSLWRDDKKLYYQIYFQEKLKKDCVCQFCNKQFKSVTGFQRHARSSKYCKMVKDLKIKLDEKNQVEDKTSDNGYNEFD